MELPRHAVGVVIRRYGRGAASVQTWRRRGMELRSSGGALQALPLCLFASRALEARCRRVDVEV